ncbi:MULTISPECIES: helix-turn-helix domain-containing protein [unclassified Oceanobacter]|uniref:helix-turn-helix domain-containing protein n=1 Tax=unclassified Oceanobacter TaxID=2620260 RepID=UPI0027369391|nr:MULTISPECIES: helix-turn-helix domain-containing protein [unclassified Oceanobacter]MDP2608392.1 helix-turn-helix domain-containing protein [Oceanobacter sp. 1_MG-2023]
MPIETTRQPCLNNLTVLLRPGFRLADLGRINEWLTACQGVTSHHISWSICSLSGDLVRSDAGLMITALPSLNHQQRQQGNLLVLSGHSSPEHDQEIARLPMPLNNTLVWIGADYYHASAYLFHRHASREALDELMITLCMSDLSADQGDQVIQQLQQGNIPAHSQDSRLQRALAEMRKHIDQPLDRHQLSRAACLSVRQLERLFQTHFNQTPGKYYTCLRLETAREHLQQNHSSVTDVAYSCGFNSVSHFCKLYKSHFGVSPARTPIVI